MLRRLGRWIRQAAAPSEESTERDGFLSWKSETHAMAVGAGAAWYTVVTGDMALLGVVAPAITAGLKAQTGDGYGTILTDVIREPHYAMGGLVLGGVLALPFGALPF